MACCYPEECCEFAVSPMLMAPCYPTKCCEDPPMCFPCLPRCPKGQMVYCCEEKQPKTSSRTRQRQDDSRERYRDYEDSRDRSPPRQRRPRSPPPTQAPKNCDTCKPVKTRYVIPCYRYEDGRIVSQLPVSAFKRNGMQDQEHSKLLGTTNFLTRCPRDVSIECDICTNPVKVGDPAKVPPCTVKTALGCCLLKKKPIAQNQPTVLMRRACEIAVGKRQRRKPFMESSYTADPYNEVHRFHSEDERGNFCFHIEKKSAKSTTCCAGHPHACQHLCKQCHLHHDPCAPCRPCQPCTSSPQCQFVDCVHAHPVDPPCCYYC